MSPLTADGVDGESPTVMVSMTVRVAGSITETVSPSVSGTQMSP